MKLPEIETERGKDQWASTILKYHFTEVPWAFGEQLNCGSWTDPGALDEITHKQIKHIEVNMKIFTEIEI